MSETASDAAISPDQIQEPTVRSRRPWVIYGSFVVVLLVGLGLVWFVLELPMGDSVRNLITYAMGIFFLIGSALWAVFLLPASWAARIGTAMIFLSPFALAAAVVRDVEWSGDMEMSLKYHWDEPDSSQRRASVPAPSAEVSLPAVTVLPNDYAEYRGPNRDGRVSSGGVDITAEGVEVWRRDVGAGWAGIAAVGDVLVTMEQIGNAEAIVCYEATQGEEVWRVTYAASFDDAMGGLGPRSTPTIDRGLAFGFGAMGHLTCVDIASGKQVWQVDTFSKFNIGNVRWATSASPLVRGDYVYVNTGSSNDGGLTCFDRETGDVVWRASEEAWNVPVESAAGYSSPMFATIAGIEQIVLLDGVALNGYAINDGRLLWSHPFSNDPKVNVAQPLVFEDGHIFIAASYGVGCEMVQITKEQDWSVQSLWDDRRLMQCKFASPIMHDGFIYGLNEGILECVNAATGKREWKRGRFGHGQILLVDDLILVMAEDGRFVVVHASPKRLNEVAERDVFVDVAKNWNPPSISRGRVFLRNHEEMVRIDFPMSNKSIEDIVTISEEDDLATGE